MTFCSTWDHHLLKLKKEFSMSTSLSTYPGPHSLVGLCPSRWGNPSVHPTGLTLNSPKISSEAPTVTWKTLHNSPLFIYKMKTIGLWTFSSPYHCWVGQRQSFLNEELLQDGSEQRSQEIRSLELKLQVTVSCPVWVLWKNNKSSKLLSYLCVKRRLLIGSWPPRSK